MKALMVIACPVCDLTSTQLTDEQEATYLRGIHDRLHHGGRPESILLTDTRSAQVSTPQIQTAGTQ